MDAAVAEFLKFGVVGAVAVALAFTSVYLYRENAKLHKEYQEQIKVLIEKNEVLAGKRTEDAQKVVNTMVGLSDAWQDAIKDQSRLLEAVRDELKDRRLARRGASRE